LPNFSKLSDQDATIRIIRAMILRFNIETLSEEPPPTRTRHVVQRRVLIHPEHRIDRWHIYFMRSEIKKLNSSFDKAGAVSNG